MTLSLFIYTSFVEDPMLSQAPIRRLFDGVTLLFAVLAVFGSVGCNEDPSDVELKDDAGSDAIQGDAAADAAPDATEDVNDAGAPDADAPGAVSSRPRRLPLAV